MNPDQNALYRGILDNPDADLPRLVYADWLEEHGQAERAEFIRVQIALANGTPADEAYCDLLEREVELEAILADELMAEKPELPHGFRAAYSHSRGMLDGVQLDWRYPDMPKGQAVSDLEAVSGLIPLCRLEHRGECGYGPETADEQPDITFLQNPISQRLTLLSFKHIGDAPRIDQLEATIATSSQLGHLHDLSLPARQVDDERFAALAGLETLPALRSLRLNKRQLTTMSNAAWRSAIWREQLATLALYGRADDYAEMTADCSFPQLRCLYLQTDLSESLLRLLNSGAVYPQLTSLTLHACDTYPNRHINYRIMFERPLRELNWTPNPGYLLSGQPFGSPGLRSLRSITIDSPEAVRSWVSSLGEGANCPELRHLSLNLHSADRELLLRVARAFVWQTVTSFTVTCYHGVEQEDWGVFFRALEAPALRHLTIRGLKLQHTGGLALAANRSLERLRLLEIGHDDLTEISEQALKAILESPHFQNLVVLEMSSKRGSGAFEILIDPGILPNARRIAIPEHDFPPAIAERLRARPGVVIR